VLSADAGAADYAQTAGATQADGPPQAATGQSGGGQLNGTGSIAGNLVNDADFTSLLFDEAACTMTGTDVWSCPGLGAGLSFRETFGASELDLVVNGGGLPVTAPEPGAMTILAAGRAAIGVARRRRV